MTRDHDANSWHHDEPETDEATETIDMGAMVEEDLAGDPAQAALVGRMEEEAREADRRYAMTLASLRKALELTQVELAQRMGVGQPAVSAIERHDHPDMLVSTLVAYLHATGLHPRIVVEVEGHGEVEIDLAALRANPAA